MESTLKILVLLFGIAICIALLYIMISINKIRKSLWSVRLQTYKVVLGNALICYKNGYNLDEFINKLSQCCNELTEEEMMRIVNGEADDEESDDSSNL